MIRMGLTDVQQVNGDRQLIVGYLLRMYPRFSQTFIVNEILALERAGLHIRIASMRKPSEGRFHELVCRVRSEADYLPEMVWGRIRKTCRVHGALMRQAPQRYLQAVRTVLRYTNATAFDLVQAGYLLRWARKRRVDHLHVHFGTSEATVALLARMLGGLPYSLALHAVDIFRDDVDQTLLAIKINASCFTVVNTEFNQRLVLDIPGVNPTKVRLCYNGVDLEQFRPSNRARRERTVLAVGRLVEKKGFIHLIRAVGRLRDRGIALKCKIVGEGPGKKRLKQEIDRLGLQSRVVLVRPLQHVEISTLMRRYSCFALPCIRAADGNMDGVPNVLIEALASGCPSVSTRLSGVPEVIEDGVTGLLVEPADDAALADAIGTIVTDSAAADRLAVAGRRLVETRFDGHRNMAELHRWLEAAAASNRDRGSRVGSARASTEPDMPAPVCEV
jgi:glycosyltransferase involved in cell wall biosynthesis